MARGDFLETYSIHFGEEVIGEATVEKQGLFYRIHCLCHISGSVPFRVTVKGDTDVDLGLCVPMDHDFGLNTSIPISKVGNGKLEFWARPKHTVKKLDCVTVSPDEPFSYLAKLKGAYLVSRDEIAFKPAAKSPNPPDNGQIP